MSLSSTSILRIYALITTVLWQHDGESGMGRHEFMESLRNTTSSFKILSEIANSTGDSVLTVNSSLTAIQRCINATASFNSSQQFLNW